MFRTLDESDEFKFPKDPILARQESIGIDGHQAVENFCVSFA